MDDPLARPSSRGQKKKKKRISIQDSLKRPVRPRGRLHEWRIVQVSCSSIGTHTYTHTHPLPCISRPPPLFCNTCTLLHVSTCTLPDARTLLPHPASCTSPPSTSHTLATLHLSLSSRFSSRFLLFLLHTADLDAAAVTGVAPAAAKSYVDRFDAGCCWHRCCYRGLVSNSRQAKTKLSAALVSSFYRLWTGEQRRAAIHVRRKRIFTGISMDRHGESDVSSPPPPSTIFSLRPGGIGD